jgi:hypothetical protein
LSDKLHTTAEDLAWLEERLSGDKPYLQAVKIGPNLAVSILADLETLHRAFARAQHRLVAEQGAAYRGHPPAVSGSDTSEGAAESMDQHAGRLRERVYELIEMAGQVGRTCDELEAATGLVHQTCSARVTELKHAGRIVDSGLRRRTRTGRGATVWTAAAGQLRLML